MELDENGRSPESSSVDNIASAMRFFFGIAHHFGLPDTMFAGAPSAYAPDKTYTASAQRYTSSMPEPQFYAGVSVTSDRLADHRRRSAVD